MAIVPKPGIAITQYEDPARAMNNIAQLSIQGQKISRCSATLIGVDGNIGVVLTAGHCVALSQEETPEKCRHQTISFSPNPLNDPQPFSVIGRYALDDYVESVTSLQGDLGLVFIDMTDIRVGFNPRQILLTPPPTTNIVQVAGYGKTGILDNLSSPQRRVMSTQATLVNKDGHPLLMLDEDAIEGQPLVIPVGDHPAEGDSGGPIIDPATGAVVGVVSHTDGRSFYSEPLYRHAEWLLEQLRQASRYFVFKTRKSGTFSDKTTWQGERIPVSFKNEHGAIHTIVEINDQHTIVLDKDANPYAVNLVNNGGTVDIQSGIRYIEVLRAYAPSTIKTSTNGALVTDEFKVGNSEVSIQTKLQILYQLHVQKGVIFNVQKDDPTRGITLIENGKVRVDGTLKAHHVRFDSYHTDSLHPGYLYLSGTLETDEPLKHTAQIIEGTASRPGTIIGDYTLSERGTLSFNLDVSSPSSLPILTVDGIANFTGGEVRLKGTDILPVGFEQVLLSTKALEINTSTWGGSYQANLVDDQSEIIFIRHPNLLKMKVVPISGGSHSTDSEIADDLVR
jgi:hypothetical protein